MEFAFRSRANTFFGAGCVRGHAADWILGTRAFVVTGKSSGRKSGALADVEAALQANGVPYGVFEGIGNNPTLDQCREVAALAREARADFIVGIGGGSPLDAAKAVAVLAAEDISTEQLYKNAYTSVLPLIAIPTTSGTGSEVTPWSVLTRTDLQTKRSFGNEKTLPAAALLDPEYTRSLSRRITLDTAMDAFTHCLESLMTNKATPVTDAYNYEGIRRFGACLLALERGELDGVREELMLVSLLGGMSIAHTGTTLMHGMGYPLTYYGGLTHGEANCAVLPAYLALTARVQPERHQHALQALGMGAEELSAYVRRNIPLTLRITEEQIRHFALQTMLQSSTRNMPFSPDQGDVETLYRAAFDMAIS